MNARVKLRKRRKVKESWPARSNAYQTSDCNNLLFSIHGNLSWFQGGAKSITRSKFAKPTPYNQPAMTFTL
jgi:hypothetical protein